jgi:DNA-binding transcriptional LysR family regulator
MEIRQLRYAVTLADELHFGRAAEREHIVQSALSQQIRRLEREIGIRLFDRNTHRVSTTRAGEVFIAEARSILVHLDRAAEIARRATADPPMLRLGFTESSYEHVPDVMEAVVADHPGLRVHQSAMSLPRQFELLRRGKLDIGIGSARFAPQEIASAYLAFDPVGVFVRNADSWAGMRAIPIRELRSVVLLRADADQAPEYNDFVDELCRKAGFSPTTHPGSVDSVRAAIDLVTRLDVVYCAPRTAWPRTPDVRWMALADPPVHYTQSVLWRADDHSPVVRSFVRRSCELAEQAAALPAASAAG